MKILVLGAGVTGLSVARLLKDFYQVKVLEKENGIGGIAKTALIDGASYHLVGGHCFNSKYKEVLDFVFSFMPIEEWHKTQRISRINLGNYEVNYPIEFSIKDIFENDKNLAYKITRDFLSSKDTGLYNNLEDWFRLKFGNTLAELYFIPYNSKIWGRNLTEMSYEWVKDKLPIPDKFSFFSGLIIPQKDSMSHSTFYYPNTNNQMTFIDRMAQGLDIECNVDISMIIKTKNGWLVNNIYEADLIISTIPLNILPKLIEGCPLEVLRSASMLKYNKISNVFWRSKMTNKTWTYQPSKDSVFHRYIHIGNFYYPNKNYTITEAIGVRELNEIIESGKKDPFLLEALSYNISDHAYVIFDENRESAVKTIQNYLRDKDIISIGRFGQWEYFNMDVCIKQSIDLANKLIKNRIRNDCFFN
jgi:protoporphyrinogen oxidase